MKYEICLFKKIGRDEPECLTRTFEHKIYLDDQLNYRYAENIYKHYTITQIDLTAEPEEQVTLIEIGNLN
jgi:hypothetical protein